MQIIVGKIGWVAGDITIPPPQSRLLIGCCEKQAGSIGRALHHSELEEALSLN